MMPISQWFKRYRRWLAVLTTTLALGMAWPAVKSHWDAAALLTRVQQPDERSRLFALGDFEVEEASFILAVGSKETRARRYRPKGEERAPGVVLLHGVHRSGIDEPRLVAFARALARSGAVVMTPELAELTDYRIDAASIPTIGASARSLAESGEVLPGGVTVMGFSFAGGLALLTAAEPAHAPFMKAVLAVGAHGDLERVARFFATNEARYPDGRALSLTAHDYGALVLIHGHTAAFFDEDDAQAAEEALRLWLWQRWDEARERSARLSPEGRRLVEELFEGELASVSEPLLEWAKRHGPELRAVSPEGRLDSVRAKVFLLHGAGDSVVPATEAFFLERALPEGARAELLVSPVVQHVEAGKDASVVEQAKLVHFIARLLSTLRN